MSKLMNGIYVLAVLLAFMVTPTFADSDCKNGKFIGTYTSAIPFPDIWGDKSGISHTLVLQLNLHSDGTATEQFSGFPDLMLSGGTVTPGVGGWQCRQDGKLTVTTLSAIYLPTADAPMHGFINVPVDLFLRFHSRTTYLFSLTDDNTLKRIQTRSRLYPPEQDPTDPNGGTLRPLDITAVVYKRLLASDADLLAP